LGVEITGFLVGGAAGKQLAQAVEHAGLFVPLPEFMNQP
jgi:hypothetical protein